MSQIGKSASNLGRKNPTMSQIGKSTPNLGRKNPTLSLSGKLTPNLDHKNTNLLNLTVLQRIDPFIQEILLTASHVTVYEFDIDQLKWSREDVFGSLFVVKRNSQPQFQFIVLNRQSTENLVEDLVENFEFEVQLPYLLYRNISREVKGFWFYNSRECEVAANMFNRILDTCSMVLPKPKVSPSKSEFEEPEPIPSLVPMNGPLEPSSTATNVLEDFSLINLSSAAVNPANNNSSVITSQPHHSSTVPLHSPVGVHSPQLPSPSVSSSPMLSMDTTHSISHSSGGTNLVNSSSFVILPRSFSSVLSLSPISSPIPTSAHHPSLNLQRPYVTPMLQPFSPPASPPTLTPSSTPNDRLTINREKVRHALLMLVQDNQFIDMFYLTLLKAHYNS